MRTAGAASTSTTATVTPPLITERMFPDIDHSLEWHAQYDGRFGAITQFTTPNGAVTAVAYDALGPRDEHCQPW